MRFYSYPAKCSPLRSVGAVVAFGCLSNVATAGLPPRIPKEDGFYIPLGSCFFFSFVYVKPKRILNMVFSIRF